MRLHINATYSNVALVNCVANVENINPLPLPSVPGNHTRPTSQKRYKSSLENGRARSSRKRPPPSSQSIADSGATLTPLVNTGKATKTCSMCYQSGHTVRHCPSLEPYAGLPLAKDDIEVRSQLSISLSQPNLYTTTTLPDDQLVFKSLPTGVQALIIHNRTMVCNIFCLVCTILHEGGVEHARYTRKNFTLGCIARQITKSKANIIISELRIATARDNVPTNVAANLLVPNYLSQLSQQSMVSQPFLEYSQMPGGAGSEFDCF